MSNPSLRILPLGGLGEIGMNCMIFESAEEIIVVDCGILFSDLDHFGVEFVIPDFTYLKERKDKVKGFVITHGHEDHIGALTFALKAGIHAPIYASEFSSLMIRERLREHGLETRTKLCPYKMGDILKFKSFKVKTVSVNHSIVDAAALIIDTPVGRVIHTGDFKIDATPFYGQKLDQKIFQEAGKKGVLLLLSDSTNVERHEHNPSESIVYKKFEQLFAAAEGLTVVAMFSSNVARMGQVFKLAKKLRKKVVLTGRSMEQNVRLGIETGYLKEAESVLVPFDQVYSQVRSPKTRKDVIVLCSGSQAEQGAALSRMALGEHKQLRLQTGDLVVLSARSIPGNEKGIGRMVNQLFKQGAHVLHEAVNDIHVSGHATRPELKKMLQWTKPKFFIPIHGEYRHLVHHAQVAEETGVKSDRVLKAVNGDVIELTPTTCRVVEHIEEPRVLVEGRHGNDVSRLVLKDRRQLGEKGVVFSLIVRNGETRQILSGPEIMSKGLVHESQEGWLIDEAKTRVRKIVHEYEDQLRRGSPEMDLQETIRVELRRFFSQNIGKKPTVMPIVLDL